MKKTVLRNALLASALVAGLSLTSCKDNNTEAEDNMDNDMETMDADVDNTATEDLDEEGARDTIAITTDTITTVKPNP